MKNTFYVYADKGARVNHYIPSGWMGDYGDLKLADADTTDPADGKTCIATVKLEPGKSYVSWLNSQKFGNFKDKDGQSAVPYLLVFETKPAG